MRSPTWGDKSLSTPEEHHMALASFSLEKVFGGVTEVSIRPPFVNRVLGCF